MTNFLSLRFTSPDFVPEHFHLMRDNHKAAMDTIEKELTVNQLIAGSCPAAGVN